MALIDSLVSYWKLDETSGNRADSHGSNNLTPGGSLSYGTGKINNAADFELDTGDYLTIADASQSGLEPAGDFSISMWVKPESYVASSSLFSKDSASNRSFWMFITSSGTAKAYINDTSFVENTTVLNTGTWYHLVFTYYYVSSGTSVMKMYVNASLTNCTPTTNAVGPMANTSSAVQIGAREYTTSRVFYDGMIDEVGFWSKVLSTDEITALYNSGNGFAYPFSTSHDYTQALSETVALTEGLSKGTGKAVTESAINLSDILNRGAGKGITEALPITESMAKGSWKEIGDPVAISESMSKAGQKIISDSMVLGDGIQKTISKAIGDSLSLSEIASILKYFNQNLTETVALTDSHIKTIGKLLTEQTALSEQMARVIEFKKGLFEAIVLSEIMQKSVAFNLAEAVALAESLISDNTKRVALSESILIVEAIDKFDIGKGISENVAVEESLDRTVEFKLALSDTAQVIEHLIRHFDKTLAQAVAITDSVVASKSSVTQRLSRKVIVTNKKKDRIILISNI